MLEVKRLRLRNFDYSEETPRDVTSSSVPIMDVVAELTLGATQPCGRRCDVAGSLTLLGKLLW
jgi:hypothetical protein